MELNKIYCGEAAEVMSNFPNDCVDLVITSPPYDNLRSYKGYSLDVKCISEGLFRIVKDGGVVVWVVCDATINGSETGTSFRHAIQFMDTGWNLHDTMIFKKANPIPQIYRKRYTNVYEYMFVFSKGAVKTHNPIMIDSLHAGLELNGTTYKNYSRHEQKRKKLAKPVKDKKISGNIWEYVVGKKKEDQEAKGHPAPFPCQLVRDHIISWSNEGDLILDPMCGSGTTCKMAKLNNRNYIGIEISPEYCEIIAKRISVLQ